MRGAPALATDASETANAAVAGFGGDHQNIERSTIYASMKTKMVTTKWFVQTLQQQSNLLCKENGKDEYIWYKTTLFI